MKLDYGSPFYWNAIGQRISAIREQLESQSRAERAVAWAIEGAMPGFEISIDRLNTYDEGVAAAVLRAMTRRAMKGGK